MSLSRIAPTRRLMAAAGAAVMILGLAACGGGDDKKTAGGAPTELTFSILSAEGQASAGPLWQPLLDDMSKAVGVPVKPYFGSNYTVLVEAMRGNHTQVGWFSAKPEVEAIDRAKAEVIARTVNREGLDSYQSTLIVKKGSGITLDKVLACGKQYNFGIGDAQSTSGTLAPLTFLFNPRGVVPSQCFKTVRSANHQANAFGVATGVIDVATSNSVNTLFMRKENPQLAAQIEDIWTSPPHPRERHRRARGPGPGAEGKDPQLLPDLWPGRRRRGRAPAQDSGGPGVFALRRRRRQLSRPDPRDDRRPEAGRGPRQERHGRDRRRRARTAAPAQPARGPSLTATASPAPAIPAAPKKSTLAWVADILVWGGVAAVLLYSIDAVDLGNISRLFAGNDSTKLFVHDLLRPDFADWKMFVAKMWETVQIALWGTFLAVILGIPLGLAAARNIAPAWIVTPVRWVMNLLRSVPDLVIGLLFVTAVGLGPLAGVLAITLNTAGVLAKLFSEAVESIDKGPVEGVRATGAGKLHEIVWGVLPQVAPLWTSFALYRFESNSRSATVLGLIGAGGIGQVLFDSMNAFDFRAVSAIVIVVVVAVTLIDTLSQVMRRRLL